MTTEIKAGLRKIGLRFDAHAVLFLCEMYDVEVSDLDKIDKNEYFASFVWCAYRSSAVYNNKKSRLPYRKMKKILANIKVGEYQKISDAIMRASPPQEQGSEGDSKKKRHGMTSSSQDTEQEYVSTTS